MSRIQSFVTMIALLSTVVGGTAHAVQRTHVSAAFGSDANTATNCTATAPCRFFQAAMTVTDVNGEVIVLDSGGYGAVTITKSLALIAPTGVYAGISVFGTSGVTIATAGINVVLRGLTINGQGGYFGIDMTNGSTLSVENCVISNFPTNGVGIYVTTPAKVRIFDTIVRNIGFGILLSDGPVATIHRSTVVDNGTYGILIRGQTAGTTTTAHISDSTVVGSAYGITALSTVGNAIVRVSVSTGRVTGNTYGLEQSGAGASLRSFGNNTFAENAVDTTGTIAQITLK